MMFRHEDSINNSLLLLQEICPTKSMTKNSGSLTMGKAKDILH